MARLASYYPGCIGVSSRFHSTRAETDPTVWISTRHSGLSYAGGFDLAAAKTDNALGHTKEAGR